MVLMTPFPPFGGGEAAYVQVIGPACAGCVKQKTDLTARRPPDALYTPRDTTEAGPRRIPPLVTYGDRAVGTEKSPYQQHLESYHPASVKPLGLNAHSARNGL